MIDNGVINMSDLLYIVGNFINKLILSAELKMGLKS